MRFVNLSVSRYIIATGILALLCSLTPVQGQPETPSYVSSISWSPDADVFAFTVASLNFPCAQPLEFYAIRVVDAASNSIVREFQHINCSVYGVDFSTDGNRLASTGSGGFTYAWNLITDEPEPASGAFFPFYAVAWQPNGINLLKVDSNGIAVYTPSHLPEYTGGWVSPTAVDADLTDATWSPDGLLAAATSTDGNVFIGNALRFNDTITTFPLHESVVLTIDWNPNGQLIASGDASGNILVWAASDGSVQRRLTGHVGAVNHVEWNADGQTLVSAGADGTVRTWDVNTGTQVTLQDTGVPLWAAAYSAYGGRIAFGGLLPDDLTSASELLDTASQFGIQTVVPDPTLERLHSIAALCDAPLTVTDAIPQVEQPAALTDFVAQVTALPEGTIPPACAADLIAVAGAMAEAISAE